MRADDGVVDVAHPTGLLVDEDLSGGSATNSAGAVVAEVLER